MKIILASKSGVRKQILDKNNIDNEVIVSNVDEDEIKELELNQFSKIIELEDTLHILKITEKNIEEPLPSAN